MGYLDNCLQPGLRFIDYAKSLTNTALRSTEASDGALTIGIFGNWGTGKTTLMRCIESEFHQRSTRGDSRYKTIWFSPWKYDTKEKIWNALIQSILAEIEKDENLDADIRKTCENLSWVMKFYAYEIGRELILGFIKHQVKQNMGFDLNKLKELHYTDSITQMYRTIVRPQLGVENAVFTTV